MWIHRHYYLPPVAVAAGALPGRWLLNVRHRLLSESARGPSRRFRYQLLLPQRQEPQVQNSGPFDEQRRPRSTHVRRGLA